MHSILPKLKNAQSKTDIKREKNTKNVYTSSKRYDVLAVKQT